jgi:hypothetical protein
MDTVAYLHPFEVYRSTTADEDYNHSFISALDTIVKK